MKPGLSARSSLLLPLLLAVAHSLVVSALQQGRRGTQLAVPGAGATRATWGGGDAAGAPPLSLLSLSDARSTMRDLVVGASFPLEEHYVTTADGYVLGVYRIPSAGASTSSASGGSDGAGAGGSGRGSGRGTIGRSSDSVAGAGACRPPVLLLHGVLDSSAAWVLNSPDESLGFILANAGYDVWLGNSRGNTFSRNHTGLDPARAAFWDFSWDEMASYDVPALVNYVLAASCGASQLAFVGHSQGTTQMFAALASSPALRSKLSVAAMLAPAVHMRHIHSYPLEVLAAMGADRVFNLLGVFEFMPTSPVAAAALFGEICRTTPLACASIITAVAGFNTDNMNLTRLALVAQFAPSGTSVKNIAQWSQAIRKSREREKPLFQMYDYGDECVTPRGLPRTCNMRFYHQLEPPSYDLGAIATPPLAVFYGGRDRLADPADVATLLSALPPGAVVHSQLEPEYEHIDFTWGINARERIYPAVLGLLRRYEPAYGLGKTASSAAAAV